MESRLRVLLLIVISAGLGGCAHLPHLWPFHRHAKAAQVENGPTSATDTAPIVEPEIVRQQVKVPRIRNSNVEVTASAGLLNVEQFGTYPTLDIRGTYHIKERFFAEASLGISKLRAKSYVDATGVNQPFTSNQRRVYDYALDLGYDVLPGEAFFGRKNSFATAVYVVAGMGALHYGNESFYAPIAGIGYRVLLSDRFAAHIDVRDAVTQRTLTGAKHLTNNVESTLGLSVYF
jgi:outer membrane beta-barrel protein